MTDNRNRTASDVRHAFDKNGGNMGQPGCVSWSFDKKGVIVVNNEDGDSTRTRSWRTPSRPAPSDMEADGDVFSVYTEPDDVAAVADYLTGHGYELLSAQAEMVPQTYITLTDEGDIKNMQKMIDMFEDNDDVQNVWHNWENND